MKKTLVSVVSAVVLSLGMTSCTIDEAAFTGGLIGGALGGAFAPGPYGPGPGFHHGPRPHRRMEKVGEMYSPSDSTYHAESAYR